MKHDLILEGPAFRLRPVVDADSPFVIGLRRNSSLNRYLHETSPNLESQLMWMSQYYERTNDYYFVVERRATGASEGLVSLYNVDTQAATGEWGRWILKSNSLAAVESTWLIYRCGFEKLNLKSVYCRTVAENEKAVSFHDSCGITTRRVLDDYFEFGGNRLDAVEHEVSYDSWAIIGPRLEKLALLTSRRLLNG